MDKQDCNLEQQVWQRVRSSREEASGNDLRQMQREAMELAAIYRGMVPQFAGNHQELVKRLYAGEKANAAALSGIGVLSRQGGETVKLWQPGREEAKKLLERCYHRTRRCMVEYLARSADGEYGVVFEKMAKQAGEHCTLIAQLLGGIR